MKTPGNELHSLTRTPQKAEGCYRTVCERHAGLSAVPRGHAWWNWRGARDTAGLSSLDNRARFEQMFQCCLTVALRFESTLSDVFPTELCHKKNKKRLVRIVYFWWDLQGFARLGSHLTYYVIKQARFSKAPYLPTGRPVQTMGFRTQNLQQQQTP